MSHLEGFTGILQVDGYAGYRVMAGRGDVELAFCWSHVRRRFYELAAAGAAPIASEALTRINALYEWVGRPRGWLSFRREVVRVRELSELRLDTATLRERLVNAGAHVDSTAFLGGDVFVDVEYGFLFEAQAGSVVAARTVIVLHDSSLPNVLGHGTLRVGRVVLEERCYVGTACVILPGIRIGRSAIVGAGSVVTRDVPPGEVWAGNPAIRISTVQELIARRANRGERRDMLDVEYVGEIEKRTMDYQVYKREVLNSVRMHFDKRRPGEA